MTSGARRGFTLVELIATITVMGAIGTVISFVMHGMVSTLVDATTASQTHAELSLAFDRVLREMRQVPLDTGAPGVAPDIDQVTGTSITLGGGWSLVLAGDELQLTDGSGPDVLMADVTAFSIRALDESDVPIPLPIAGPACDAVRRLEVTATATRLGTTTTLRSRVFIRSTMVGAG